MKFDIKITKFFFSFVAVLLLVVFAVIGAGLWWKNNSAAPGESGQTAKIIIPKGYSAMQTANELHSAGVIVSPLAFKIYVQFTDKSGQIKPGEYNLPTNMTLVQVIKKILKGPDEIWITIPEGLRREEIAERIISQLEVENSEDFYLSFLEASDGLEGFLFPDTYLFPRDISPEKIVTKLRTTFDQKYDLLLEDHPENFSADEKNEIVIMASIIERETKSGDERPIVAGILWKRLQTEGWLLQADATIQYAVANLQLKTKNSKLENYWPILTKEDIEIDSLYNSYKYKELPPTPISNPGEDSLQAAISPLDSQYWFYIHDNEGNIHYAETLSQHNQNIAKYLNK